MDVLRGDRSGWCISLGESGAARLSLLGWPDWSLDMAGRGFTAVTFASVCDSLPESVALLSPASPTRFEPPLP